MLPTNRKKWLSSLITFSSLNSKSSSYPFKGIWHLSFCPQNSLSWVPCSVNDPVIHSVKHIRNPGAALGHFSFSNPHSHFISRFDYLYLIHLHGYHLGLACCYHFWSDLLKLSLKHLPISTLALFHSFPHTAVRHSIWRCFHFKVKVLTWPIGLSMLGVDFLPSIFCVPCSLYASYVAYFHVLRCAKHLLSTGPLHLPYPQSWVALPLPLHLLNAFLFLYFSVSFPSGKCWVP